MSEFLFFQTRINGSYFHDNNKELTLYNQRLRYLYKFTTSTKSTVILKQVNHRWSKIISILALRIVFFGVTELTNIIETREMPKTGHVLQPDCS